MHKVRDSVHAQSAIRKWGSRRRRGATHERATGMQRCSSAELVGVVVWLQVEGNKIKGDEREGRELEPFALFCSE